MKLLVFTALLFAPQAILAGNIAEELTAAGATTLVDLVVKAGLADTVSNGGPFTVFAPTNEAFAAVPQEILDALNEDVELLKKVLLYHVVSGAVKSTDLTNDMSVPSVAENPLRVNIYLKSDYYKGFVTVNGKRVTKADIEADNGVIHMVDQVIYPLNEDSIPAVLTKDGRFGTLLKAVTEAGLVDTLSGDGPFTVFAPTDDAFAKVPAETLNGLLADKDALTAVLLRHVLPTALYSKGITWQIHDTAGEDQIQTQVFKAGVVKVANDMGSSAKVIDADLGATNGVVHVIDTVI